MTSITLGPNRKLVDIPDYMLKAFDEGRMTSGGLKDYAIGSRQATPEELGFVRTQEEMPSVSGPMQAAMIGAGRETVRAGSNLKQAFSELSGNQEGAMAAQADQAEMARLAEPVKAQYPKASFAGEMLPGFAIPGGKIAQIGAGAALGGMEGDTPLQRIIGAATGAGGALLGQQAGKAISNRVVPKIQGLMGGAAGKARDVLASEGMPLTFGQKGSKIGQFVDVLKETVFRKTPLKAQQVTRLNQIAAGALGEKADDLTKPVLNRAATRIGAVYDDVAEIVGSIGIGADEAARLTAIDDMIKSVPEPSKVTGAIAMVEDVITNPKKGLTGESYNTLRQKLGRVSRQLWSQGSGLEGEVVDELIDTLDDALEKTSPEAAKQLAKVRPQWRFLTALRRGASIDPEGNINPRAMNAAMESVYKGFDIGNIPQGEAGRFGRTLDAYNMVAKPFKSSGTAERLGTLALPALLGAGAVTGGGPILGGGLALATMLSGGGTGAMLGGNSARELSRLLSRKIPGMNERE